MLRSLSGPSTTRSRSLLLLALTSVALVLLGFGPARATAAQTVVWNGSVSSSWTTAANWTPSVVPGAGAGVNGNVASEVGDNVATFNAASSHGNVPTINAGTFLISGLTINSGGQLYINGTGNLTDTFLPGYDELDNPPTAGSIVIGAQTPGGAFATVGSGNFNGNGEIHAVGGGTISLSAGAIVPQVVVDAGNTLGVPTGTATVGEGSLFSGGAFTGTGTLKLTGSSSGVRFTASQTIPAGFTLDDAINGGVPLTVNSGTTLTNSGTVILEDQALLTGPGTFTNAGTGKLTVVSGGRGYDDVTTNGANAGTITVPTGSALDISHATGLANAATHTLLGSRYVFDGQVFIDDLTHLTGDSATSVTFGPDGLIDAADTFTTYGDGVHNDAVHYTGDIEFDTPTELTYASVISLSDGASITNDSEIMLDNYGRINDADSLTGGSGGTFTNAADGTIDITAAGQIACIGQRTFINHGVINVSGADTLFQDTFGLQQQSGTLTVGAGASLSQGPLVTGGTVVSHGTLVDSNQSPTSPTTVHGGTLTLDGGVGSLIADGGTITIANAAGGPGTLTAVGAVTLSGGVNLIYPVSGATTSALVAGAAATAGGSLELAIPDGSTPPAAGSVFANVISGTALVGAFATAYVNNTIDGGYLASTKTATALSLMEHAASITASPITITAGAVVTVGGSGFVPGESVHFGFNHGQSGGDFTTTDAVVGADGTFSKMLTIPADFAVGAVTLVAIGEGSGAFTTAAATIVALVVVPVPLPVVTPAPTTPIMVSVPTLVANIGKTPTTTTLTSVLTTGLVNTLHCNQACTVTSTLYVTAKEAKALGLLSAKSKSTKAVAVGTVKAVSKNGGAFTVKTKLSAKAKKAIAKLKTVTLSQTVKVTAGKTSTATTRRVTLRTPVIMKNK